MADASEMLETGLEDTDMEPAVEERGGTFFMDADFDGAEALKPGDPISLVVVGRDADGRLEVEVAAKSDGEPEWKQDLKRSVPTTPGGGGIGNEPERY